MEPEMATEMPVLPVPPKPTITGAEIPEKSLQDVKERMEAEKAARDAVHEVAKEISPRAQRAIHLLHTGDFDAAKGLLDEAAVLVDKMVEAEPPNKWNVRGSGSAQGSVESFVSAKCLHTFFTTGKLLPQSEVSQLEDSEYLAGVMSFCQELPRYAVGQATVGRAGSIMLCRHVVEAVQGKLMEFDFRNGPLRRKFDGIKYATKRLDDLLYELSLTGAYVSKTPGASEAKRRRTVPDDDAAPAVAAEGVAAAVRVTEADFDAMRDKMAAYDAAREDVIKRCRDAQKLSKQAIYSLHRGQLDDARAKLENARTIAEAIFEERVKQQCTLRYGSFANALEEYAEGAIFLAWLETGRVPPMSDLALLEPTEYIGGLVDFTGEVGRVAVMAATRRDQVKVEQALTAALTVQDALMFIGLPGKLSSKEGALRNNIKKMEHVLYELSLVKASGRNVTAAVEEKQPAAAAAADE